MTTGIKTRLRLARSADADVDADAAADADAAEAMEHAQSHLRDRFIDAAAHDIRTPLQVVSLHLHSLLEGGAAQLVHPEVKRRLQVMERHVEILTRLSNRLVDVARADDGALQLRLEPVDLVDVVSRSVERMGEQLAWAKCSATIEATRPVRAIVDAVRIDEVMSALLANAVKYAPASPIVVSISASAAEAVIQVADQGPGIQAAVRGVIFNKYQRGSHNELTSGLGLGLWLSRKIIHAHGGVLTLDEHRRTGATFIIRLPLHEVAGAR